MRRAALLLLVALLLVPAVTIATPPDSPEPPDSSSRDTQFVTSASNTQADGIRVLTLDDPGNAELMSGTTDLGTTLSADRAGAGIRLERYAFEERTNGSAPGDHAVSTALERIENQSDDLLEAERDRWRGYANGTIDNATLFRGLAETKASARELNRFHEQIATAQGILPFRLRKPVPTALDGPVRARITAAVTGAETGPIYVETSPDGIVLATMSDGRYVREAYRLDRQSLPPEQFDSAQPSNQIPVLQAQYELSSVGRSSFRSNDGETLFRYSYEFEEGSIRAYLDGGTEEVFYEEQTRDLDRFSGGPSVSATDNGTRLVVNRSYAGGPLRIATYDNETGIPISSTVVVDGKRLDTGSDYVTWTLTPPGGEFDVTAIRPRGRVTVSLSPLEPDGIDDP